jgi:hypothetical protein
VNKLLNPAYWGRALSHPLVFAGLLVDLMPIYALFAWGWTVVPLVMLYWMENVIAGVMTIPRLLISGARFGFGGAIGGIFMSAFFVFHYGMFCLVHGTFLVVFASFSSPEGMASAPFMDVGGIFRFGLESAEHVDWIAYAIIGFQIAVFLWEFILKGGWKVSNLGEEMAAPYGRVVVLHIALFVGFGALILLGQPMLGVLALIILRAVWGIAANSKRLGVTGLEAATVKASTSEQLRQMLQGKDPGVS